MLLGQCLKFAAAVLAVDSAAFLDDDAHDLRDAVRPQAETALSVLQPGVSKARASRCQSLSHHHSESTCTDITSVMNGHVGLSPNDGKCEYAEACGCQDTGDRPFHCGLCNRSFARVDTLSRHKRTHRDQALDDSDGLAMPIAPQNLDDTHHLPDGRSDVDWSQNQTFEQASLQPLAFTQVDTLHNVNTEPPNFSPFGNIGTEDFLQYIFPSPQEAMLPFARTREPFGAATEANITGDIATLHNGPYQAVDSSPPALLQLNAMIHDNVSSDLTAPHLKRFNNAMSSLLDTSKAFGRRASTRSFLMLAFPFSFPNSTRPTQSCTRRRGN